MDACLLFSLPWPYFIPAVIIALNNWVYLGGKLQESDGALKWMRVQRKFLEGAYDEDRWARFARRFTYGSMIAFPVFGLNWFFFAHAVFPFAARIARCCVQEHSGVTVAHLRRR